MAILERIEWLAATIDCEGTMGIYGTGPTPYKYFYPRVTVTMTHWPYMIEVQRSAACGNLHTYEGTGIKQTKHMWTVNIADIFQLCKELWPHMIIKRSQTELIINYYKDKENNKMTTSLASFYAYRSSRINQAQFIGQGPGRPRKDVL